MDLVAVHIAKVAVLYYTIAKKQDASHTVFGGFHMKKELSTGFNTRQYMNSGEFEVFFTMTSISIMWWIIPIPIMRSIFS